MLSSLPRFGGKGRQHGERSPFSSPYSGTPVAARRSSLGERRRPAADFDADLSPTPASRIDEEDEEGVEEEEDEVDDHDQGEEEDESNEDGAGETSPLLPIFSAAHLGDFYP